MYSLVVMDEPAPLIRRITLNRPEKWNALSRALRAEIAETPSDVVQINQRAVHSAIEIMGLRTAIRSGMTAVNLKGPFRLGAQFGGRMAAANGGSIVNVSTLAATRPSRGDSVYACAKAGLNALTVALADVCGPSVRCNCLVPGAVLTDVTRYWTAAMVEASVKNSPPGRIGQPDDYVGPALWLVSRASSFVTGAFTRVDGGVGMSAP